VSKKVSKKGPPGECFIPLSENIENLCKVVLTSYAASGNPAVAGPLQIFKCFLIHATAGPHARKCPRAYYRLSYPEKSRIVSQKFITMTNNTPSILEKNEGKQNIRFCF